MGDAVVLAVRRHAVAVAGEQLLQLLDGWIGVAKHVYRTIRNNRRRLDPEPDAGIVQRLPGKFLARILLARGRDVGVGEHAVRWNAVAREDAAAERRHGCDLTAWEIRIAVVVSRVDDLDADRARVEIGLARP